MTYMDLDRPGVMAIVGSLNPGAWRNTQTTFAYDEHRQVAGAVEAAALTAGPVRRPKGAAKREGRSRLGCDAGNPSRLRDNDYLR
jgi:hypothetical protein